MVLVLWARCTLGTWRPKLSQSPQVGDGTTPDPRAQRIVGALGETGKPDSTVATAAPTRCNRRPDDLLTSQFVAPRWSPNDRLALVDELEGRAGAESEKFFDAHGLGAAYRGAGQYARKLSRINAALNAAEESGVVDDILDSALQFLRSPNTSTETASFRHRARQGDEIVTTETKVFLSHASADKALADLLRDTLVLGGVSPDRIFYSSDRGTGIPSGEDVGGYLRKSLRDAGLVIELLSQTFLTRPMCLMELGGAWTMKKPTYPIVIPPLTRDEAARIIGNVQMGVFGTDTEINAIFDELHGRLEEDVDVRTKVVDWRRAQDAFKLQLSSKLATANVLAATTMTPATGVGAIVFGGAANDPVTIKNISLASGRRGRKELHAEATNSESVELSFTVKGTFYDAQGHISGVSDTVVNQVQAGRTKSFTLVDLPDYSSGKVEVDTIFGR